MPGQLNGETGPESPSHHIEVVEEETRSERGDDQPSPGLRDSKGWDGKLRIDRNALVQNPEALSDPEYSDEENVLPGQEISADEGEFIYICIIHIIHLLIHHLLSTSTLTSETYH